MFEENKQRNLGLSVFILKLIAVVTMLIDHVGCFIGEWSLAPFSIINLMRAVGRISFPIFAFMIVNGWNHTHDREKYFTNMVLFAVISHIPFTLAFYPVNNMRLTSGEASFAIAPLTLTSILSYSVFIVFGVAVFYFLVLRKKKELSIVFLGISLVFALPYIKVFNVWILSDNLNVFYTLASGIYAIYCWEFVTAKKHRIYEYVVLLPLVLFFYFCRPVFGVFGTLLILVLHICKDRRLQCLAIVLYGIGFYGIQLNNWSNAATTALAAVLVFFYNERKGKDCKAFFYSFYPAHLVIIGFMNIYMRLFA